MFSFIVTELHSDKINLLYIMTEFYCDKYIKICPNLSSRTYGSVWQGFGGQAIYETVCQRLTRTSRFIKQSDRVSLGQDTSVKEPFFFAHLK